MRAYGATAPDLQQIKPCRLASGAAIKEHPNAVGTGTGRCPGPHCCAVQTPPHGQADTQNGYQGVRTEPDARTRTDGGSDG